MSMTKFEHYCRTRNTRNYRSAINVLKANRDIIGSPSFLFACRHGNIKVAKWIVRRNSSNINMDSYNNAFELACKNNHIKTAKWLLKIKPNIWFVDDKLLIWACEYSSIKMVNLIYSVNLLGNDLESAFCCACKNGYIVMAERLLSIIERTLNNFEINISTVNGTLCEAFCEACENNQIDTAKWLFTLKPDINISVDDEFFRLTCAKDHLELAKWLLTIKPDIDISAENEYVFMMACSNGHIDIAKWLLEIKPDIDISTKDDFAFLMACSNGYLEIAKWLLKIKPDIDISAKNEFPFRFSCYNGHIAIAKWLYSIKPDIDINIGFRFACGGGRQDIAKWLLTIKPDIDISSSREYAFRVACKNGHQDIAKWFQILNPDKYIVIIENNKIISYYMKKSLIISKTIQLSCESITDCNICMDTKADIQTDCSHQICKTCIERWMQNKDTCPMCRTNLQNDSLSRIEII